MTYGSNLGWMTGLYPNKRRNLARFGVAAGLVATFIIRIK